MASDREDVYATLLLNDFYLPGALVVAHSLRDAGTTKKLAVLVTTDTVSADAMVELQRLFDFIIPVERLINESPANLSLMDRTDLHSTFTKIALWKLVQFRKIVYVDADMVALRAPDELFDLPHDFSAAPDIGWPDIFNTGLMVLTPNMGDYYALLAMAQRGISFDGADQGLLNMHFKNTFNRLSFTYNVTPSAHYQYLPAYRHFQSSISMAHFIGQNKPWTQGRDANRGATPYDEMVGRWWAVYDRHYRESVGTTQNDEGTTIDEPKSVESTSKGGTTIVHYHTKGEFHPVIPVTYIAESQPQQSEGETAQQPHYHPPQYTEHPTEQQEHGYEEPQQHYIPHQIDSEIYHPPVEQHLPQPQYIPQPFSNPPQPFSQPPQPYLQPPYSLPNQPYAHPQPIAHPHQSYSQPDQPYSQPPQSYSQPPQSYSQPSHESHESHFEPAQKSDVQEAYTPPAQESTDQGKTREIEYSTWDARTAPPPTDSKPEASNFPATHYEMSSDPTPFQAPERYPEPPKNMYYEVPKTPTYQKPAPIFPWEKDAPKATRVFPEDNVDFTERRGINEPVSSGVTGIETEEEKGSPVTPTTPTFHLTPADPWQTYTQRNAWDDIPEIERYIGALQKNRKGNIQVLQGYGSGIAQVSSPGGRRHSMRLTDFPTELERPSLPVTPAPIRRPSFWGEERDAEGELPAAEGVPSQEDWDPAARLDQLARRQSDVLASKLGLDGASAREIPSRNLPYGSEGVVSPTYVAQVPISPAGASGSDSTPRTTVHMEEPRYTGPGAAWDKDEMYLEKETPLGATEDESDVLES